MRCEMMTAGTRCVLWVGLDRSREERTTKGQQSFTIRFRRDKLGVIFSRIRSRQPWMSARPSLGMHPASTLAHPVGFGYARFGFKK